MKEAERLKQARDLLLKLHKELVDFERQTYTTFRGAVTATQFLTQLIENPDLSWLRKFSILIVDIDEMFAARDGYSETAVRSHLGSMRALVAMEGSDEEFRGRFSLALKEGKAAGLYRELSDLLS